MYSRFLVLELEVSKLVFLFVVLLSDGFESSDSGDDAARTGSSPYEYLRLHRHVAVVVVVYGFGGVVLG